MTVPCVKEITPRRSHMTVFSRPNGAPALSCTRGRKPDLSAYPSLTVLRSLYHAPDIPLTDRRPHDSRGQLPWPEGSMPARRLVWVPGLKYPSVAAQNLHLLPSSGTALAPQWYIHPMESDRWALPSSYSLVWGSVSQFFFFLTFYFVLGCSPLTTL